jgi:tetratricopeptide (TPR) repeat protein
MSQHDHRGDPVTGATPAALQSFETALAAFRSWRGDADAPVSAALQEAPAFVMAHVLRAYLLLCSRDPANVRAAAPAHARAARLAGNRRERLHVEAIGAALRDDYAGATAVLSGLLSENPRDVLALQVLHALDYLGGDVANLKQRATGVLPAWSADMPGYHAVLAMLSFGLAENGDYARAEDVGLQALAHEPLDARAHHAIAHVFEMAERPEEGLRWLDERRAGWDGDTAVATHCAWHMALLHLQRGEVDRALALYDRRIRTARTPPLADLIDASALLWRVRLEDGDCGDRWQSLAADWAPRIGEGFCSFSDVHAMLAFVGARDWDLAGRHLDDLSRRQFLPGRHAVTTRGIGLPACRALLAFERGDHARTTTLLERIEPQIVRLGGSHAQRGVLPLTLRGARQHRSRRIGRAQRAA